MLLVTIPLLAQFILYPKGAVFVEKHVTKAACSPAASVCVEVPGVRQI